jgi:hypothetical protein
MDHFGGARAKSHIVHSCEKRLSIKLKRLIVSTRTRYCLTKDDVDLRVTIYHIREDRFGTGAHILAKFHVIDVPLQLLNSRVISLLMHCITALLTSLTPQALLQVALDKEASHSSR